MPPTVKKLMGHIDFSSCVRPYMRLSVHASVSACLRLFETCMPYLMHARVLKGHLCLWWEDSLKEKYNTKYYKIYFYLACISFEGQKHIFWQVLLWLRPLTWLA